MDCIISGFVVIVSCFCISFFGIARGIGFAPLPSLAHFSHTVSSVPSTRALYMYPSFPHISQFILLGYSTTTINFLLSGLTTG